MTGIMDPVAHARLIADLPHICDVAGVRPSFMEESMVGYCSPAEVEWVRQFPQKFKMGKLDLGLVLEGVSKSSTRCQAIAAALIRNFIDARVIPLNRLLEMHNEGQVPMPTVLLIPNLYVSAVGTGIPAWRIQVAYDLLLQRSVKNKSSVVCIEEMGSLGMAYGAHFVDFLSDLKVVKQ